jgi:hypothetical protein
MEEKRDKFEEQQAPLKNTDHAFVQVAKDGSPKFPEATEGKEANEAKTNDKTKAADRR